MNIVIKNAAISIDGNTILDNINFEVNEKSKIGIVGVNGSGKSTLLKSIIDNDFFSNGSGNEKSQIIKNGKFKIGYVEQVVLEDNKTLEEFLFESFKEIRSLEKEIEKLNNNLNAELSNKYNDMLNTYKLLGGYTYKKDYEIMLKKFGFVEGDKNKEIKCFSGGEKTKIAFMKLLLSKPDILIMDEPTNNLDINAIEWLENYLQNYSKAIILVSHDRMFLNKIVKTIYEVANGTIKKYSGNYDYYEKAKDEQYNKNLKDYEFQQKEIERLRTIYEKFRNKPSKASMALSKLKIIEKMKLINKPNIEDKKAVLANINNFDPSGKIVVKMENLVLGYENPLFSINAEIKKGDKIAVVGANGIGKSTLIKTICGKLEPLDGLVSYGLEVRPAYFDQNITFLNNNNSVLEEFLNVNSDFLQQQARSYLALFSFKNDDVNKKINVLSGGEKVKLKLALIFAKKPNFLILDEVTNHVDIDTKEYLKKVLSNYNGTILFISHDRDFIDNVANKMYIINKNQVDIYNGNYSNFINQAVVIKEEPKKEVCLKNKNNGNKVNKYDLKKEINKLENEIVKLEVKIKTLKDSTFDENIYSNYEELNKINKEIDELEQKLQIKNSEWENLFDEYEKND